MNGLQLSLQYYKQYGEPMLRSRFAAVTDRIAVGLVGHGSECFGYDDDVSLDHDYSVGFCLWLTDEDMAAFGQDLQSAYMHLPQEYAGRRLLSASAEGNNGRGVKTIRQFYTPYVGEPLPPASWRQWLAIDSLYLAEATNGAVFCDPLGQFSRIRQALAHYPTDVRYKKLAAHLLLAAQSGQYNYARCVAHGQMGAAVLALHRFAEHAAQAAYLLADRYAPYYKWLLRGLDDFDLGRQCRPLLEALLVAPHTPDTMGQDADMVEQVAAVLLQEVRRQGLSDAPNDYLEPHAYQIRRRIQNPEIRALHIMQGV